MIRRPRHAAVSVEPHADEGGPGAPRVRVVVPLFLAGPISVFLMGPPVLGNDLLLGHPLLDPQPIDVGAVAAVVETKDRPRQQASREQRHGRSIHEDAEGPAGALAFSRTILLAVDPVEAMRSMAEDHVD